ncbi:30S ribosomal protein S13 [Candidatus Woesearchaeota archaeon]|nr:30S ribosomal protein S13 [Candidatus Woesearchaeota archaeon]
MAQQQPEADDFRHLVRVVNTDLDGRKQILYALQKIKGVGYMYANAACNIANINKMKKTGNLSDDEVKRIDEVLQNPDRYHLPLWMLNRRKDYETGQHRHVFSGDLDFAQGSDIRRLKMIKAYKGVRHAFGLPVRGQRTKSNFRRNKGKVLGVRRNPKSKAGRV